jgi:flagellar biosynthetic protein FliR
MIEFTFAQLQAWIALFLWPFTRIAAFIMVEPLLGHSSTPTPVKVLLAALLSVAVSATLAPMPNVPVVSWAGFGILAEQIIIGAALGLVMQVIFAVVQAAGDVIGLQMGLSFASFFAPDIGANTMILSRFFYMIAMLSFLAFDGHLILIRILAESFTTLPVSLASLDADAFAVLVRFGSVIFSSGLLLALPLVGALLVINFAMAILNRVAPQFTVFSVGFPMSLIAGLVLLTLLMSQMSTFLTELFMMGLQFMQELVESLGGA